ncbi:Ig-like domain-containing protein [Flavobacterium aestivum]|uniref:Ig-like domain-containing protein n=1 Tax=Flavobacterium aestivum TaxID=3003257 RepID=UPI0024824459|nr:Ig-like domain-containing protein [Flavobacterium aestivum]
MKRNLLSIVALVCAVSGSVFGQTKGLIISEVSPKPSGTESPYEYVELVATQSINFATTPYTVVVSDGAATANGWKNGGNNTYAFQISTGSVNAGQVVYVGGSSMAPLSNGGVSLRSINTSTVNGDVFGTKNISGVFGNGGSNMDGIAVFNVAAASITSSTVPVDAIFWGSGVGSAYLSSTSGFQLPVNDKYNGGKVATNSFKAPDPSSGDLIKATAGTFDAATNTWTTARTWAKSTSASYNTSSITVTGTGGNQFPTVSITSPTNNTNFTPPANITITANASDADGSVSQVEFYNGTTLLGTATTSPYSFAWNSVTAGTYTLTAKAYDDLNAVTTSSAVTVTVSTVNQAPTLSFLPAASKLVDEASGTIACVKGDATDPVSVSGLDINVTDESLSTLTFTMTSSKTSVVPNANFSIVGTGNTRKFIITPTGVGYATITLKVTDNAGLNKSISFSLGVTNKYITTSVNDFYHTGSSDGSAAIAIDNNYMFVGDDETTLISLYNRNASGLPIYTFDPKPFLNLATGESDLEAAFVSPTNPNRIYWFGSQSNNKNGESRPDRDRVFVTDIVGTGANATLTFVGSYQGLRSKIIAWGDTNGYALSTSAATGMIPKRIDGYNIEGAVMGPDGTTAYICFRAPYVNTTNRNKALICPINNFETWFNNGSPVGNPTFGTPIELNLGTRGIRDIAKNASNQYVIVAGAFDTTVNFALYSWNGQGSSAPTQLTANLAGLAPEGIIVPASQSGTFQVQLISDEGADTPYGDAIEQKDITTLQYRRFVSSVLNVSGCLTCKTSKNAVTTTANRPMVTPTNLVIYPNPLTDKVTVLLGQNELPSTVSVKVISSLSQIVASVKANVINNSIILDLHTLNQGVYFISIEGIENVFKIIKQ